jgi:hypothetical protein
MNDLSTAAAIMTAMLAPVVLIMASGSLILTTSQRLTRVIERARKLTDLIRELIRTSTDEALLEKEVTILCEQLRMNALRARLIQRSMTCLYLTLAFFLATCLSIGIIEVLDERFVWIPVIFGLLGAVILFYSSILMIIESRIALTAVDVEMKSDMSFVYERFPRLRRKG